MQSEQSTKTFIRAVVRQIHPDLFSAYPWERSKNAESLKALNVYADQLSRGEVPNPANLEFYIRNSDTTFSTITARLSADGSLGPLFLAFGLITPEEATAFASQANSRTDNALDLFQWLSEVAADAALAADQHDALKRTIRASLSELEDEYGFSHIDIGGQFSVDGDAQVQQAQSLNALRAALQHLQQQQSTSLDVSTAFAGLPIRLYHPSIAPLTTVGYLDGDGTFHMKSQPMTSHVSDNGILHLIGDVDILLTALPLLDLERAALLARVNSYWSKRSRQLVCALKSALAVEDVWFDTRPEQAAQRFVLWAGTTLQRRGDIDAALGGRSFSFSLLVHSDESSPLVEYIASSSVLQVRTDCPPKHLLAFMASEAAALAHRRASMIADERVEEEKALAAVRDALGAKHVVRVCSASDQNKVMEAAQRLVEAAPTIRASMDLSGVSLAIDDCYEVWDSGFISIPFDFQMADLKPQLKALLMAAPPSPDVGIPYNGAAINGSSPQSARDGVIASASRPSSTSLMLLDGRVDFNHQMTILNKSAMHTRWIGNGLSRNNSIITRSTSRRLHRKGVVVNGRMMQSMRFR